MLEIKQRMRAVGVTAYRLAKLSGVSKSGLSMLLNGKREPMKATYDKLDEALKELENQK